MNVCYNKILLSLEIYFVYRDTWTVESSKNATTMPQTLTAGQKKSLVLKLWYSFGYRKLWQVAFH